MLRRLPKGDNDVKAAYFGILLLLAVVAAGLISSSYAASTDAPPPAYTYRLVILTGSSTNEHQTMLNQMGDAGWELVGVESNTAYLKRQIR